LPVDEDQGLDEDQPAETTDRVVRRLTTRQDLDHAVAEMNRCMRGFMATCKADPLGEELRTYSEGCKPLFDLHFDPNWHDPRDNWFLIGRTMITSSVTIWKSNRQVQKCVRLQEEALAEKN
jgi:hypothetical protein